MPDDQDQKALDKQAKADAKAEDDRAKAEAKAFADFKQSRKDEAMRRIDNETLADIGLDRRKDKEVELAQRQAQEQIDAEAEAKK